MPRAQLAALAALWLLVAPAEGALEVIGSGYGRTGTETLRVALNTLGYKTYHMKEIIDGSLTEHVKTWHVQLESKCADVQALKSLFEDLGYTAAVDFPASMCWETLMKAYPDAKIVHTRRKSFEVWWESATNTILVLGSTFPFNILNRVVPFFVAHKAMVDALFSNILGKPLSADEPGFPWVYKAEFKASYEANNDRVVEVVPRERLLVQDHAKGWTLLCEFLGKAIPATPYPHVNTPAEFKALARNLSIGFGCAGLAALAVLGLVVKFVIGLCAAGGKTKGA